jgi:hypothetical protein
MELSQLHYQILNGENMEESCLKGVHHYSPPSTGKEHTTSVRSYSPEIASWRAKHKAGVQKS